MGGAPAIRTAVQRWLQRSSPDPVSQLLARCTTRFAAHRAARPRIRPADALTIVVGALSMGGAGKTPVVRFLARRLAAAGRRVAIVARGYGGAAHRVARVELPDAAVYGDEPAAMRRALPAEIPIFVGRDRAEARRLAAAEAEVVLVDDGFQDPSLPRTADLVVVDATAPLGVLPAGPLREPLAALSRADLVWSHKVDEPGARSLPAVVESAVRPVGWLDAAGHLHPLAHLGSTPVAAVCGIGRPDSFWYRLETLDVRSVARLTFADHHPYRASELAPLLAAAPCLVTTDKDLERLPSAARARALALVVEPEIRRGAERLDAWLEGLLR